MEVEIALGCVCALSVMCTAIQTLRLRDEKEKSSELWLRYVNEREYRKELERKLKK